MRNWTTTTTVVRPARVKFVGQWSTTTDLSAKDWRVEVAACHICGQTHRFELSAILTGVKSARAQAISYKCPLTGVSAMLSLRASDVRTGLKYLRRSQPGYKHIILPPPRTSKTTTSKRINPLPGLSPTYNTPDRLRWRHEG